MQPFSKHTEFPVIPALFETVVVIQAFPILPRRFSCAVVISKEPLHHVYELRAVALYVNAREGSPPGRCTVEMGHLQRSADP